MLVILGRRERTQDQYEALLARSGYRLERVIQLPEAGLPWVMIEARAAG